MAPANPRVVKAFRAMQDIGIPNERVKPVLKKLLSVYDKNWDLIEAENYRVLADAIFEEEQLDSVSTNTEENAEVTKKKGNAEASSSKKKKKVISEQEKTSEKEKMELLGERTGPPMKRLRLKYQGLDDYQDPTFSVGCSLRIPKDEPIDDSPDYTPLAVIHPETSNAGGGERSPQKETSNEEDCERSAQKENGTETLAIRSAERSQLHVASTPLGEVKISLSCDKTGFRMPSLDAVVKMVEDRCLHSYKILDSSFSVKKLMEDMCECFLELGSGTAQEKEEFVQVIPRTDIFKRTPAIPDFPPAMPLWIPGVLEKAQSDTEVASPENLKPSPENVSSVCNGVAHVVDDQNELDGPSCMSLVVVQQNEANPDQIRALHDMSDISRGLESVVIPVERGNRELLSSFSYISQNAVFLRASVDFSLAGMGDDYCSACFGNCLSSDLPCVCASETGGEFAYTDEGLVKEKLLDESISLKCSPQDDSLYFCKECPLERSKNGDMMEPCKGHLVRSFIKECSLKCGCNKKCGNRVVQRGISYKLQVFDSEGKGWGLRTLEDLPKGAFVCEYVGEVLTNVELFERVARSPNGEGHSYPVLLDADWGSQRILKDEEALCLDGSRFGNVARFINHRCSDANLIEIPVEIENPDHHYYHIAFFTTREVKAMEELTWDYGIDFDDVEHPVKAFQCLCGSQYCRNIRRLSRSISLPRA